MLCLMCVLSGMAWCFLKFSVAISLVWLDTHKGMRLLYFLILSRVQKKFYQNLSSSLYLQNIFLTLSLYQEGKKYWHLFKLATVTSRQIASTQGGSKCTHSWAEVIRILPCAFSGLSQEFSFLLFLIFIICKLSCIADSLLKGASAGKT